MSRHLRFVPEGGAFVEVTCRTIQGRLLLRPSQQINDVILGVLGRAQRSYPIDIIAFCFLSSHYHMLLWVENAKQLADFMGYFNGNVARKLGRLTGWTERLWSRRYQAILISDEESAQVARLKYVLSNGCKENLVASPLEWPGVHCVRALLLGEPVEGTWQSRTLARTFRLRGKPASPGDFETRETVVLCQLPCWKNLSSETYRLRVAELVREIEETAATERKKEGVEPLGVEQICAQKPEVRPETLDKSPAPFIHAATQRARKMLYEAYAAFVAVYREAADKLKRGDPSAAFPPGSFPPHLPFVPA
jgi:REP element-mobilizing transposase RayT